MVTAPRFQGRFQFLFYRARPSLHPSNSKRKATPFFSTSSSSGWTPLGRGSDGRFGLRRFRAKPTPTPFGTHRAFTHALPPSFGLRSVPFAVPVLFLPAAAQVKEETSQKRQKGKNNEIRRSQQTNQRGRRFPRRSAGVRSQ